jgi:hypothetical protein
LFTPWGSEREIHIHIHIRTDQLIVNHSTFRLSVFAGSTLDALVNYLLVDQRV